MTFTNISEISFESPILRSDLYIAEAYHKKLLVSKLVAIYYPEGNTHVLLDSIVTNTEYRHRGISRTQVENLIVWSKERNFPYINGYIGESLLQEDTLENVSTFFLSLGFLVNDNRFRREL